MPKFIASQIDPFTLTATDVGYKGTQTDIISVTLRKSDGAPVTKIGKNGAITINAAGKATAADASPLGAPIITVQSGAAAAGPITAAVFKVGDRIVAVPNLTTPADAAASFESVISVAGQVQQTSASNLSASKFMFIAVR